ncbi:hypothetical protein G4Y79_23790 [Phototrophicus methaneseepsis]|uniref:Uncharacterized protein n=1 Tax=Phototrophicus methaneseepsis TaxID=2710758 RepID=A0A7S8E958_9CHLR|nr:hypothetical protein [Phototrophicus methaneseepsis]QPC82671.1 hypothetical protein G4Y79_23790 [Phototrophicus methaneseepsis]
MTINANRDKKKRAQRPNYFRRGCVSLLILIVGIPVFCYGSMWLFAQFGGEWASSIDLPIAPDSEFVSSTYDEGWYVYKTTIYTNQATPEELRQWYIQNGITLSPIPLNLEGTEVIDYETYYGTMSHTYMSEMHNLYNFAAALTHGWFDEIINACQSVRVYKNTEFARDAFPELTFPDDATIYSLTTCWIVS